MKIQINGFDIEVNTEEENMSIKVIDASGKELSNNTYSQTLEGEECSSDDEVVEPDMENTEESEEPIEEPIEGEEPVENVDATEQETENENYIPDFETFKSNLKK